MGPNDDLSRWGEPPASDEELELARILGEALERGGACPPALSAHLRASDRVEDFVHTVLTHCGASNSPGQGEPGGAPFDLRLVLLAQTATGYAPLGSTNPSFRLRDLKRVPEADGVTIRTGDRVRIVAECSRAGYLTVLNIGPRGNLNLLAPADLLRPVLQQAGMPLVVADVQATPPAGAERVYAVWSEKPLDARTLAGIAGRGTTLRDMVRVQAAVDQLRPDQWRAAVLEIRHEG